MYKNAYSLYEILDNAAREYNKRNHLPSHRFGAEVVNIDHSHCELESHTRMILKLPMPGIKDEDLLVESRGEHFRLRGNTNNFGVSYVSLELEPEYHTFLGFKVFDGVVNMLFEYNLPEKYNKHTYHPHSIEEWVKVTAPKEKKNDSQ